MDEFELELKQDFLEESTDLLEAAESAFLRLEDERDSEDLLNEIFRLAHNLKGTAKAVGFDQLSDFTHTAENLILKLKEGTIEVTDEVVSTLLEFKDKVCEIVEGLKEDLDASFDLSSTVEKLESAIDGTGILKINGPDEFMDSSSEEEVNEIPSADQFEAISEESSEADEIVSEASPAINSAALESLMEAGFDDAEMLAELSANQTSSEVEEVCAPEESAEEPAKVESVNPPVSVKEVVDEKKTPVKSTAPKKGGESDESIRVKLEKIDLINNVIGELVILQTVVGQRRYEFIQDELSNQSIGLMGKLFKEVQELAMSLRMLPLKGTFQKMTRIVRDTSKSLGKEVKLVMSGEETEVDKTILEKLGDPLVHIVRNAVDHGLELPSDRAANGKKEVGTVILEAFHEGSNLVIQVKDDGKGIDPNVIRRKAIEKNILSENNKVSDEDIIQYIFHAGFSTKEQVTEVSGRGVGMDVVKTNIEGLGGEVLLTSKLGEGSCLKIILPLTLAIIEGIVIKAGIQKYVLPLSQINEITQVSSAQIQSFSGIAQIFELRGEPMPLFFLNKKLGMKPLESKNYTTIVVRAGAKAFGVVVDDIINQQQIVIKKLGQDVAGKKGIMGSAIMSDGKPALILDVVDTFKGDLKESRGFQKFKEQNIA